MKKVAILRRGGLSIMLLLSASGALAQGGVTTVSLDQKSGTIEFRATGHPSALRIVGKGAAPLGDFTIDGRKVSGKAQADLTTLDTGIGLRNHHMKERYLEVGKYPKAVLTVTSLLLPKPLQGDVSFDSVPFTGSLLLHGVEKPVVGTATIEKKGDRVAMKVRFGLKIKDYGIAEPSFAGITMADDVQVSVETQAPYTKE